MGVTMTNGPRLLAFLLLACCHQSLCAAAEWLGKEVFFKDTAVAKVGTEVVDKYVDKYKVLAFPATVGEVNGEWLWLGRSWVKKSDCMNLEQAFNNLDEAVRKTATSSKTIRHCHFQ